MVPEYLYEESRVMWTRRRGFRVRDPDSIVMPGLVPGIHVFGSRMKEDVDGRDAGAKRSFVASPAAMTTGAAWRALSRSANLRIRHCERGEVTRIAPRKGLDCFVATLLAMTWRDSSTVLKKSGGVSPAALISSVDFGFSEEAEARSAGTGWPATTRTPRSTGGSTAPGCWPLPRWCRPASGWTSRSAARRSGSC